MTRIACLFGMWLTRSWRCVILFFAWGARGDYTQ